MTKDRFIAITEWQKETFPTANAKSKATHLKQEVDELIHDLETNAADRRLEYADIFLLAFGSAAADGMTYEDIMAAIDEKFLINQKRIWGKPDADGVVNHVKPKPIENFEDLIGKTMIKVYDNGIELFFETTDGQKCKLYHEQDCCESVGIESIDGDLNDLIGSPIAMAEEVTSNDPYFGKPENPESFTWTFYKLATAKGYVTVRFLGESNGYYSEGVSFKKTN
jgi:hypothetical protein